MTTPTTSSRHAQPAVSCSHPGTCDWPPPAGRAQPVVGAPVPSGRRPLSGVPADWPPWSRWPRHRSRTITSHVTNYRGLMRVYHERLWVPVSWWLLGLVVMVILSAELAAGFGAPVVAAIYAVLIGGMAATLLWWSRSRVEVAGGELIAGRAQLPLAAAGEVSALDRAQTRAIIGPRADPAAFILIRPYLREAVYVEVTEPASGTGRRRRLRWQRWRPHVEVTEPSLGAPYWLVATRHPAALAAAINSARPAARAGGTTMG